ncbi:hypothetical protein EVAR_98309_1 [Eumeta japonica]|uniref:Uncharacterized protein n=1 Tax=Eumeta variegata TaxID=151549 RepID=A0A4C1XB40_EUMVA|nr:hypothetical protein EVAR_98309_1 [Eumeta japonica]
MGIEISIENENGTGTRPDSGARIGIENTTVIAMKINSKISRYRSKNGNLLLQISMAKKRPKLASRRWVIGIAGPGSYLTMEPEVSSTAAS